MLWVFIAGMFLGANIGVIVACMLVSVKKRDAVEYEHHRWLEHAIMDHGNTPRAMKPSQSSQQYGPIGS